MPMKNAYPPPLAATAEADAYLHIQTAIRMGTYAPGMRLIAEDIATEIGSSRMPVREAFRRLATEGLVVIRPNRGAIVSGLGLEDMREVFETRAVLEGLAIRTALPRMTPATIDTLERMLDRMDERMENSADWTSAHRDFHEYLCSLSGRPRLMKLIADLHSQIESTMRLWFKHLDRPLSARDDHMDLIAALRTRDLDIAEAAMREHVQATVPELMQFLETRSPPSSALP
ncbi:Transcriptional regulator, GntR family [plant metagenome]|uniref:Transcriptional regulator, GntR family n=1 Tax=plant metagenome TaxID=1297885 RepID=A0A484PH63_9ZZZZ